MPTTLHTPVFQARWTLQYLIRHGQMPYLADVDSEWGTLLSLIDITVSSKTSMRLCWPTMIFLNSTQLSKLSIQSKATPDELSQPENHHRPSSTQQANEGCSAVNAPSPLDFGIQPKIDYPINPPSTILVYGLTCYVLVASGTNSCFACHLPYTGRDNEIATVTMRERGTMQKIQQQTLVE